jgi:hypothetical protein
MRPFTVIKSKPRKRRTHLGDLVTVTRTLYDGGFVHESITIECPLEIVEPGQSWPTQESRS